MSVVVSLCIIGCSRRDRGDSPLPRVAPSTYPSQCRLHPPCTPRRTTCACSPLQIVSITDPPISQDPTETTYGTRQTPVCQVSVCAHMITKQTMTYATVAPALWHAPSGLGRLDIEVKAILVGCIERRRDERVEDGRRTRSGNERRGRKGRRRDGHRDVGNIGLHHGSREWGDGTVNATHHGRIKWWWIDGRRKVMHESDRVSRALCARYIRVCDRRSGVGCGKRLVDERARWKSTWVMKMKNEKVDRRGSVSGEGGGEGGVATSVLYNSVLYE